MKTRDMRCSMTMKIYENMTIDQKTRTCKVIPWNLCCLFNPISLRTRHWSKQPEAFPPFPDLHEFALPGRSAYDPWAALTGRCRKADHDHDMCLWCLELKELLGSTSFKQKRGLLKVRTAKHPRSLWCLFALHPPPGEENPLYAAVSWLHLPPINYDGCFTSGTSGPEFTSIWAGKPYDSKDAWKTSTGSIWSQSWKNTWESVFCMSSFHRMLFLQVSLGSILSLLLAGCLGRYCMQLLNEQYHSLKKNQTFIEQLQG